MSVVENWKGETRSRVLYAAEWTGNGGRQWGVRCEEEILTAGRFLAFGTYYLSL